MTKTWLTTKARLAQRKKSDQKSDQEFHKLMRLVGQVCSHSNLRRLNDSALLDLKRAMSLAIIEVDDALYALPEE